MRLLFTIITVCLLNLVFTQSIAQGIIIEPLKDNRALQLYDAQNLVFRTVTTDTPSINLPFIDDFSYAGPAPSPVLWLDKQVFVNTTNTTKAPSYGFATFDGINSNGRPYDSLVNYHGSCDSLTSTFINLATYQDNAQTTPRNLTVADSVYLSFFIQPKGLCYPPLAASGDSMVLEFKDSTNQWNIISTFQGLTNYLLGLDSISRPFPLDSVPPFTFVKIKINDARYFNNKFQLRFHNYGRRDGAYEQWHIDYIKIAPNGKYNTTNLDDVTFTDLPPTILAKYTSLPYKHFKAQLATEISDVISGNFNNLFATARNPTQTNATVSTSLGTTLSIGTTLLDGVNIPPSVFYKSIPKNYPTTFRNNLKNIPDYASFDVYTDYSLTIAGEETRDVLQIALKNNSARRITRFSNYFAYDDGTAELQLTATGENTQTAYRFKTNINDTLRGVAFFFPHINGNATGLFNLNIYKDSLTTKPLLTMKNNAPFYLDQKVDSLQGFSSYGLKSPLTKKDTFLVLPAGDFYISWQNVGDVRIPIGLDRSNLSNSKYLYQYISGVWLQDSLNHGTVMIRPIMGSNVVQNSSQLATIEPLSEWLRIFPTPANDNIFIESVNSNTNDYTFKLINLSGVVENVYVSNNQINVAQLSNGFYLIQAIRKSDGATRFQKIIIAH